MEWPRCGLRRGISGRRYYTGQPSPGDGFGKILESVLIGLSSAATENSHQPNVVERIVHRRNARYLLSYFLSLFSSPSFGSSARTL